MAMHIKEQEASSLIQEALAYTAAQSRKGGGAFVANKLKVTLITGRVRRRNKSTFLFFFYGFFFHTPPSPVSQYLGNIMGVEKSGVKCR